MIDINLPSDLFLVSLFVFVFLIISIIFYKRSKSILLSVSVFSILSNLIILFVSYLGSLIFFSNNIMWLKYFSIYIYGHL